MDNHIGIIAEQAGKSRGGNSTGYANLCLTAPHRPGVGDVPLRHNHTQQCADEQGIHLIACGMRRKRERRYY